jgi:hypothetical protein
MTALNPTHGSVADVLVNGYVVSQYLNDMAWAGARDKAETTAFKSTNKAYVGGVMDSTAAFSGMFDGSNTSAIDSLLQPALSAGDQFWFYAAGGCQGAAAFGNVGLSIGGFCDKYEIKSAIADANRITANVQTDGNGGGTDRGFVYAPYATQAAPGNTASLDFGSVSTTNGGVLVVHTANDTASLVVSLFDSADNSTFAAVSGYTVSPANATTAAYRYPAVGVTPTGTVRRYTRINWTGTGTFMAFFSRK